MLKQVRDARDFLAHSDLSCESLQVPPGEFPAAGQPLTPAEPARELPQAAAPLHDAVQEILSLFEVAAAIASRSAKDVFPFYLKEVDAFHQLSKVLAAAEARIVSLRELLGNPGGGTSRALLETLCKLAKVLKEAVAAPEVARQVGELEGTNAVFCTIRNLLGQEGKTGKVIREEVWQYLGTLAGGTLPEEILATLEKRFTMYDNELYVAYDHEYVPRTNNALEAFNNHVKRPIRKGMGKMESWFYVEHQGVAATYYQNLVRAPHVVGGTAISWDATQSPLERVGALETLSVTAVMSLVDKELLAQVLAKNDQAYATHRWTCKISRLGLDACLETLDQSWANVIAHWQA
ncbi:MAG TPA: hypothetical protein VKK79_05775 [Candidatus Lokiarchaeia archaeon]|nr:hypothetical protein [Candidatus Lokiarchaeia archaeon]